MYLFQKTEIHIRSLLGDPGRAHLVIGCAPLPVYMYTVLGVLCTAGCCIFIMIEVRIIKAMLSRCDRHADYIIILGAQVRGKRSQIH